MATAPVQLNHDDVELQEEGEQAAQSAPEPLQNATRDLGVQYRAADDNPNVQKAGYKMVAGVEENDPRTIGIEDKQALAQHGDQIVPHELYHTWTNNLPGPTRARIPKSASADDYAEPTVEGVNAMRAQGKTLLDVPNEKAAQMMAWAGRNKSDPKVQAAMKPYLDDMRNTPESVIEGTAPTDKEINTQPRAPMGPRDDIPGMEAFNPAKHFVKPGTGGKLSAEDAQKYLVKAKGNKEVARAMAKHDNHAF